MYPQETEYHFWVNQDGYDGERGLTVSVVVTDILMCLCVIQAGSKRGREEEEEEEEESRPESSHTPPTAKKLRLKPTIALQVNKNSQIPRDVTFFFTHGC